VIYVAFYDEKIFEVIKYVMFFWKLGHTELVSAE
jgi:hypothetical protein